MNDFPRTSAERREMRGHHFARIVREAERVANLYGLSMKCSGQSLLSQAKPRHAGDADGCRNDGSTCLCLCHDDLPEENPTDV